MQCKYCGELKAATDFYKDNRSRCKDCRKAYQQAYIASHKELLREKTRLRMRKYRLAHPDYVQRELKKKKTNSSYKAKALVYATKRQAIGKEFINTFKNAPCVDCGGTFPQYVMDFDHVRGVKTANLSEMGSYMLDRVIDEIEKCDLVCANCHRMRTYQRQHAEQVA